MTEELTLLSDNAAKIVNTRYLLPGEESWKDICQRVSRCVSAGLALYDVPIEEIHNFEKQLYQALLRRDFIFNSPTLFNAGRGVPSDLLYSPSVTLDDYRQILDSMNDKNMLSACFVIPVENSIQGIYKSLSDAAIISKLSGGVGFDFSKLSHQGRPLDSGVGMASGPLSFMQVFDTSAKAVMQGGKRRSAQMGILRIDHPDIIDFISAKAQGDNNLSFFNISVMITDEFMKAVKEGTGFQLKDPVTHQPTAMIDARGLWENIIHYAWQSGDPGLIFFDSINRDRFIEGEYIEATNPCITGDTLVAVADGRGSVPIRQLAEEGKDVPVYTIDDKGKLVIRMMRNPRCTGKNKPIYRVTLDSGNYLDVTADHKFYLKDGTKKEAKDLQYGDKLDVMSKVTEPNRNTNYINCYYRSTHYQPEHKMIYNFYYGKPPKGLNIHHKNGNSLDNRIENLDAVTMGEHNRIHDKGIGESNGRFIPVPNEEIKKHALLLTKQLKRRFGTAEWEKYAKANGLPITWSNNGYRAQNLGTVRELAQWAANTLGLDYADKHPLLQKTINDAIEQGYEIDIRQIDGREKVFVKKYCEYCGSPFWVEYVKRGISFDSYSCATKKAMQKEEVREKIREKRQEYDNKRQEIIRQQQAQVYADLQFKLGRQPQIKEWKEECRRLGISSEIKRKSSPFKSIEELAEAAEMVNCKVVSVEFIGYQDVYNGTVDDYHNFFIGGFECKTNRAQRPKVKYVRTANCGEIPTYSYSSCTLGHINLAHVVKDGHIDLDKIHYLTKLGVQALDLIIDINHYPLPEIAEKTKAYRPIGLGVMGFAHLLFMLGIRYGSQPSIDLASQLSRYIAFTSIEESINLAKRFGAYPAYQNGDKSILETNYVLDQFRQENRNNKEILEKYGLRNASWNSIAPTGSVSLICDTSSGIEPVFALEHERVYIDNNGEKKTLIIQDPIYEKSLNKKADYFVDAHSISPEEHVLIQAAWQSYISSGVSKTINLPHNATEEDVKKVYELAYELGCKGVTVYRDGCKGEQVLYRREDKGTASSTEHKTEPASKGALGGRVSSGDTINKNKGLHPIERPKTTYGVTSEFSVACGTLYVTLNFDEDGNPIETFLTTGKGGVCRANVEAVSRTVSLALRSGIAKEEVVKQLKGIRCPYCLSKNKKYLSCADALAKFIERCKSPFVGKIEEEESKELNGILERRLVSDDTEIATCPECGAPIQRVEGCITCMECGYSKCS